LIATSLFDKVSIERAGDRLVVHLSEAPVLDRVAFEGNKKVKDADLAAAVEAKPRGSLQRATVQADVGRIMEVYLRAGCADVIVSSAKAEYDPAAKGFTLNFAIDEGQLYHFREISVACNVPGMDCDKLRALPTAHPGAVFDGNALDKTTELLAIEMAKLGYPFAQATPRLTRDAAAQRIDVAFVIEQGPRTYIERIEIHGNTRTRDYVIRREFDIAEGDAYNKALIDRAERRLKNLNYFKTVK